MKYMFIKEALISIVFFVLAVGSLIVIQLFGGENIEWGRDLLFGLLMGIVVFIGMFSFDRIKKYPDIKGNRSFKQQIISNIALGIVWGITIFISQIISQNIGEGDIDYLRAGLIGIFFTILEFASFTFIDKKCKDKKETASLGE